MAGSCPLASPPLPRYIANVAHSRHRFFVQLLVTTSPYPDRIVARRTLTNLFNARPVWLAQAHATLDASVAAGTECGAGRGGRLRPAYAVDEAHLTDILGHLRGPEAAEGLRGPPFAWDCLPLHC